jgi:uncharacterized DUF497 family protein
VVDLPANHIGQGFAPLVDMWIQEFLDHLNSRNYNKSIQIDFDPDKRNKALTERGLDFARAGEIFPGRHFTAEDTREDYSEPRYITLGKLEERMVVMVWTPRGEARRIISMRKANEREQARYAHRVD